MSDSASEGDSPRVPAFAAFASRDFSLYLMARTLSAMADSMLAVAVGWQVYDLTGSTFDLGMVGLINFLPRLILILPSGQLADKFDRRYLSAIGVALETFAAAVLCAMAVSGAIGLGPILIMLVVTGAAQTLVAPALRSMINRVVPGPHLPNAISWSNSLSQTAMLLGPVIAGFGYALGASWVYGAVAVLCVIAMVSALALKRQIREAETRKAPGLEHLLAGIRYVWAHPVILGAISLDLFAVLLGGATALLPVYAKSILHVGPVGLGILRSAPAVGAATAAALLARFPLRHKVGRRMLQCVAGFGAATIVFGLSRNVVLSLAALVALGAFDAVSVFVRVTLVQIMTPDAMRGRVGAVQMLFVNTSNQLGEFESGMTASWLGTVPSVVAGGVGTILVVLFAFRYFRELRDVDGFATETSP